MKLSTIRFAVLLLLTSAAGGAAAATAAQESGSEPRVSESAYFADDGREQAAPNRVSTDTHTSSLAGSRDSVKTRGAEHGKLSAGSAQSVNTDFWFYDVDVELFADDDRDGYYHGIDLWFDVDTRFISADVYAVVYLSRDGGPWVEYAATESFSIYGTSATDDYVIVTELLSGYPAGSYDILIELFDAWDHSFVADIGPENSSALAYLPLEDAERDQPIAAPAPPVAVSRGGGGAADPLLILMLAGLTAVAVTRRRRLQAARAPGARCA